ncbi:hypothetical protein Moror_2461 [Moniliophthora roreri MCA 2997]|uniref:Uncharacterized protein n=1 Tax=Moniliophthora roreri (strain MCA 2997) TaxID=1381753 RepID=V2WW00_MONRO|nr:hypothetical protein Moror_2461 [Moniliophthora roreri MCA 2997]KAI3619524.1 hypothetical protein WG66_000747 [Moniliophthora roreri]
MLRFFYFLFWLHAFVPWALTFKIDVQQLTFTIGQNASYSWTWNQTESDPPRIAIGLRTDHSDECPIISNEFDIFKAFKKEDLVGVLRTDSLQLELDNTKRGTGSFPVMQTGPCYLCAYSFNDSDNRGQDSKVPFALNLLASSPKFNVVLPSQENGKRLPTGAIAGIVIGSVAFLILLIAGFFLYRRVRYRRRLAQFHKERLLFQQTPPPSMRIASPVISEKRSTITTTNSSTPLIQSPKRPHSHRRSIPFGYDDNMTKTYQFPPSADGAPVSSISASTPLPVALPINPERALHRGSVDSLAARRNG